MNTNKNDEIPPGFLVAAIDPFDFAQGRPLIAQAVRACRAVARRGDRRPVNRPYQWKIN